MSEMVARVAEVMMAMTPQCDCCPLQFHAMARAAIAAMREPTAEMVAAMRKERVADHCDDSEITESLVDGFRAAIDDARK